MKKSIIVLLIAVFAALLIVSINAMGENMHQEKNDNSKNVAIVWTSGDKEVAIKMTFMYTFNAKSRGWMNEVHLIIWGPSAKLLSEDAELQEYVKKMKEKGVVLFACKACADMYGVSEKLTELGVDVKYMGVPLSDYMKNGWNTLTF